MIDGHPDATDPAHDIRMHAGTDTATDPRCQARLRELAQLATLLTGAPMALVCTLRDGAPRTEAVVGLSRGQQLATATDCAAACTGDEVVVVPDTYDQPEAAAQRCGIEGGPPIRAYVLVPLCDGDEGAGALAVLDPAPRPFSEAELTGLRMLARQVEDQLHLRRRADALHRAVARRDAALADAARAHQQLRDEYDARATLEESLVRAQRLEGIGALAGGIAHDLNNILGPILMAAHLLRPSTVGPDGQELLSTIETSARMGADLVQQILIFARGQAPSPSCDVKQVVLRTARWVEDCLPSGVTLDVHTEAGLPEVAADPTQLQQVLLNLVINARDALADTGGVVAVRVHCDAERDELVVEVEDDGPGMSEEVLAHAMEPLFSTKGEEGTGLGLSTVAAIAARHGGTVALSSTLGQGTRVQLRLPMTGEQAPPRAPGDAPRVLVVHPNATVRWTTKEVLEEAGYTVAAADGLVDALRTDRSDGPFAAVVLGHGLPQDTAEETAHQLLQRHPDTVVLAPGRQVEGWHPLPRTYTPSQLLRALDQALRHRS